MLNLKTFIKIEEMERLLNLANQGYYGECMDLIFEISHSLSKEAENIFFGLVKDSLMSMIAKNLEFLKPEINIERQNAKEKN